MNSDDEVKIKLSTNSRTPSGRIRLSDKTEERRPSKSFQ